MKKKKRKKERKKRKEKKKKKKKIGQKLTNAFPVTIPETIAAPVPFSFLKWQIHTHITSTLDEPYGSLALKNFS